MTLAVTSLSVTIVPESSPALASVPRTVRHDDDGREEGEEMKRSTYSDVAEMKVRFGKLELALLRWAATEQGVALSEIVRRFVGDALTKYRGAGWYQPEPEQESSVLKQALSIDVVRKEQGDLYIRYPVEFSMMLRGYLRDALNQHVSELEGLIPPAVNEQPTYSGGEDRGEIKTET